MSFYEPLYDSERDDDSKGEQPGTVAEEERLRFDTSIGRRMLLAPWSLETGPDFWETFKSLLLELVFSFILGFGVVSARHYATLGAGSNGLQNGFFIGIVHAAIFLIGWNWTTSFNLKRHLNWAITVGYMLKFTGKAEKGKWGPNYGLLAWLLYGGMQLSGAALAGALLHGYGTQMIPNPSFAALGGSLGPFSTPALVDLTTVSTGLVWFVEFLGSFVIVLTVLYNDERHQDYNDDKRDSGETELQNHSRTGYLAALAIVTATTVLYPLGSYSFGPVPYFAGLVGVGVNTAGAGASIASNPAGTRLIDWAHYLFTPVAGAAVAAVVAYTLSALESMDENSGKRIRNEVFGIRRRYTSATPLTQTLLNKNRTGLRNRQEPIAVRQFK